MFGFKHSMKKMNPLLQMDTLAQFQETVLVNVITDN